MTITMPMVPYLDEPNKLFSSARAVARPVQLQHDRLQGGAMLHHSEKCVVVETRDQLYHHLSFFCCADVGRSQEELQCSVIDFIA